jgi:hypothetical protein
MRGHRQRACTDEQQAASAQAGRASAPGTAPLVSAPLPPLPPLQTMMVAACLLILPSVLLRDLSLLSYVSVGGLAASMAVCALVAWDGAAVTGFPHRSWPLVTWSGLPVSTGVFAFCFAGQWRPLAVVAACALHAAAPAHNAYSRHQLQQLSMPGHQTWVSTLPPLQGTPSSPPCTRPCGQSRSSLPCWPAASPSPR